MKKKTIIIAAIVLSLLIIAALAIVLSINHINAENENENTKSEVNNEESIVQTDEQLTKSDESETPKDPMDDVVVTLNEDVMNGIGRKNSELEAMYGTFTITECEDEELSNLIPYNALVPNEYKYFQQFENCPQRFFSYKESKQSKDNTDLYVNRFRAIYLPVWDLLGIKGDVSFEKISENKDIEIVYTGEDYQIPIPNDTIQEITYFKINIDNYPGVLDDDYYVGDTVFTTKSNIRLFGTIFQHNKGYVNENDWVKLGFQYVDAVYYANTTIYFAGMCDTDNNTFKILDVLAESVAKLKEACFCQIVTVYDKNGNIVDDDKPIEPGMKIRYFCKKYYEMHEYTVIEILHLGYMIE